MAAGEVGDKVRRTAEKQERRVERHPKAQKEESPQQGGKEEDGQVTGCRLRQSDH